MTIKKEIRIGAFAGMPQIELLSFGGAVSWKRSGNGVKNLRVYAHKSGGAEVSLYEAQDGAVSRETMMSLSRDQAAALRDFLSHALAAAEVREAGVAQ